MGDVTRILEAIDEGDPSAADDLLPVVYDELRRLAAQKLNHERPGQTLQATALVHEAYIRLVGDGGNQSWDGRGHFFSAAAEAMRRILVERARRQGAKERSGQATQIDLADVAILSPSFDLLSFDEVLTELAANDSRAAELVKLRIFAGLSHQQAAESIGVTRRVADRHWRVARAGLTRELGR